MKKITQGKITDDPDYIKSMVCVHRNICFVLDATFKKWQDLGIVKCSDLFIDNIFANYNDLIKKCNLQKTDFFRYLQVRHFKAHCSVFPQMPSESGLDLLLKTPTHLKGLISKIYNFIMSFQNISLEKIKTEWIGELGIDISEDTWDKAVGWKHLI